MKHIKYTVVRFKQFFRICRSALLKNTIMNGWQWLLLNTIWAIVQLYHDENKLHSTK